MQGKRKSKKKAFKNFVQGTTYRVLRTEYRKMHEDGIEVARKLHACHLFGWDDTYPNRRRVRQILKYERKKYAG